MGKITSKYFPTFVAATFKFPFHKCTVQIHEEAGQHKIGPTPQLRMCLWAYLQLSSQRFFILPPFPLIALWRGTPATHSGGGGGEERLSPCAKRSNLNLSQPGEANCGENREARLQTGIERY